MSIQLVSPAFSDGEIIPLDFTGDGTDHSPPLAWSNVPANTQSLALICDDPDAPSAEPWVHWLIYHLSPQLTELPEAIEPIELPTVPAGAVQGRNSWSQGRTVGYRGPAPPPGHGLHHYHFRLYALDQPLQLAPGADVAALQRAMRGHVLAIGELVGTYQR
jgi:Raf kinase inhibitor-like YbhB/YbcL family protein